MTAVQHNVALKMPDARAQTGGNGEHHTLRRSPDNETRASHSFFPDSDDALSKITLRLSIIGDRVRAVVNRESRGVYLHGRGGTGKTTKVLDTLSSVRAKYEYFAGKITPGGLREFLADCVERNIEVVVFDDVSSLLGNKDAVQLLLAVMDGKPTRYHRQGALPEFIEYERGLIFISNEPIPDGKSLAAFKTRVRCMEYQPTDDELAILMREWARGNGGPPQRGLSRDEAIEVVEFLIAESTRRSAPLDLRLVKKGYSDYRMWKRDETENHWKVLVTSEIEQSVIAIQSPRKEPTSRGERLAKERDIVRQILKEAPDSRIEQLALWQELTNLDDRRFDRRKREVVNDSDVNWQSGQDC